jgi:hypothetical protein
VASNNMGCVFEGENGNMEMMDLKVIDIPRSMGVVRVNNFIFGGRG